ncbi:MAG: HypC/HybG/HupF family hydrogenase formation chaperone [Bacteroidota bacterium]
MCLAIPGQIRQLDDEKHYATVEVGHVRRSVNVDLLRDEALDVGDWVLIHVGFAMSKISAAQAEEQIRLLEMLGEADEALEEIQGYAFGTPVGLPPGMADRLAAGAAAADSPTSPASSDADESRPDIISGDGYIGEPSAP